MIIQYQLRIPVKIFVFIVLVILICLFQGTTFSQENNARIIFWNTENLFDIEDDSTTIDEEYTPDGIRHWNNKRFYAKLNNVYKVIISIGEWEPPSLVGLCEIENRNVLNKLIYQTPLINFEYKIIHEESPDRRGIDVALLYRQSVFDALSHKAIPVRFSFDVNSRTRDILYVKGVLMGIDTLHLFINHWPSRYGGYLETKPKREFVAAILRAEIDSLNLVLDEPKIVIMGDFNDGPSENSINNILVRNEPNVKVDLINLMDNIKSENVNGTNKYQGNWSLIDQFIVSANLLENGSGLKITEDRAWIYAPDFLRMEDEKYMGIKPYRTFYGSQYLGGFSDHLPVFIDLKYVNP